MQELYSFTIIAGLVTFFTFIGETKEGLVLWYAFEGTGDIAKDISGNGNDGSITGAKRVPGKFTKGIEKKAKKSPKLMVWVNFPL